MRVFPLVLALLLTPSAHAAADPPLPPLLTGVHRIVTMGDSITQAGGQPGGYVTLLGQYLAAVYPSTPIEIVNAGISGHKATDMQARFDRDVIQAKPDLVTINVGVNDVWHAFRDFQAHKDYPDGSLPNGVPLPLYREKLEAMITAAEDAGIKVVLLTPTVIHENLSSPENQRLAGYIDAMKALGAAHHCPIVDLNAAFTKAIATYRDLAGPDRNLLTVDGVHMNPAGNQLMAWQILRGLGVPEADLEAAHLEGVDR